MTTKDEILEYLDNVLHPLVSPEHWNVYSELHDMVEDLPDPVKHGHWIQLMDYDSDSNALFECSVCRGSDMHAMGVEVPYCWHCGARMEEDK